MWCAANNELNVSHIRTQNFRSKVQFSQNCPKCQLLTKIIPFKYNWKEIDQLLLLLFHYFSCEPLLIKKLILQTWHQDGRHTWFSCLIPLFFRKYLIFVLLLSLSIFRWRIIFGVREMRRNILIVKWPFYTLFAYHYFLAYISFIHKIFITWLVYS